MAKGEVRAHVVQTAAQLLGEGGPSAASLGDVLKTAGVSRGSTYHHFPDGKRELYASALDLTSERMLSSMEQLRGRSAGDVAAGFFGIWRTVLTTSELQSGCAVLAVAVSGEDRDNVEYAGTLFTQWRLLLASLLHDAGMPRPAAATLAATILASAEGVVAVARAEGSLESFDLVARQITEVARVAAGAAA